MRERKRGNAPGSDQHFTPPEILDRVERVAFIGMDPASHPNAPAWQRAKDARQVDGLDCPSWDPAGGLIWLNPPFSNIGPWVSRACSEAAMGHTVVVLVPCRTSQPYWEDLSTNVPVVAFWRGNKALGLSRRVRFLDVDGSRQIGAPFDTAIFLLSEHREHRAAFRSAFADVATVLTSIPSSLPSLGPLRPNMVTPTERVKGQSAISIPKMSGTKFLVY